MQELTQTTSSETRPAIFIGEHSPEYDHGWKHYSEKGHTLEIDVLNGELVSRLKLSECFDSVIRDNNNDTLKCRGER